MQLKIPFSEKFLWVIFNLMEEMGRVGDTRFIGFPRTMKDALCRDAFISKRNDERERARKDFRKLIYKLKQNGYFKSLKIKNKSAIMLTAKGMEKIFIIKLKLTNRKPRKDKKWQMVLFDIPEKKRRNRDLFRRALQNLGYKKLQKSIWVCPYDVLKETKDLIKRHNLKLYVELLLVKKIGLG